MLLEESQYAACVVIGLTAPWFVLSVTNANTFGSNACQHCVIRV
jgi:hypothetical protein